LKMASSQIQMASNRETALLKQSMREIAGLLQEQPPKEEKARLQTEAFIRDDILTQAYDILKLQCDLLVEKVRLIEQSKKQQCPPELISSVATLIYATPFVNIKEFPLVQKQLRDKYGKDFIDDASTNKNNIVNEKIALLFPIRLAESRVVQNYMIYICKQFAIDWRPSNSVASSKPSTLPTPTTICYPAAASLSASASSSTQAIPNSQHQDRDGLNKTDWLNEYDYYDMRAEDNQDEERSEATTDIVAHAVLVSEQPPHRL